MQKIERPPIKTIIGLIPWEEKLTTYCQECEKGERIWRSSGDPYNILKKELSILTLGHCSFCDGYPFSMSTQTIEHYFPNADFKEKTYEWDNLFLCCTKCQNNANKIKPFQYTLKPDEINYSFDAYFWLNAENGRIEILENIEEEKQIKTANFLIRYGLNDDLEVLNARRRLYQDLIKLIPIDPKRERSVEPNRFVIDAVINFLGTRKIVYKR